MRERNVRMYVVVTKDAAQRRRWAFPENPAKRVGAGQLLLPDPPGLRRFLQFRGIRPFTLD